MRNKMVRMLFPDPPPPKMSSFGEMMLCKDDPLRDTPEKAERYALVVRAIAGRNLLSMLQVSDSWKAIAMADIEAAAKVLGVQF